MKINSILATMGYGHASPQKACFEALVLEPNLLNLAAASFELRIIEFFAEWSVALMPARHVLETRSPHLSFMLVEDSFKEFT